MCSKEYYSLFHNSWSLIFEDISGFSCHNNLHQSKDIVNCVVNILSSLGDGSSEVVDANIELKLTNLHFRSMINFIFYVI